MSDIDIQLRVDCLRREADGVISLVLADPRGRRLPDWEPGAHIQLHLPSGRTRQYSLYGGGEDGAQYRIAVKDVEGGRGGSREIHSNLRLGDILKATAPANNFALEKAQSYIFIAGGIGITPILPMANAVKDSSWHLYYAGRSLSSMGLLDEVKRLPRENVTLAPGETDKLKLRELVKQAETGSVIYACGPSSMLDELAELCGERQDVALRIERFSAPTSATPTKDINADKAFEVVMKRSGRRVLIPAGSTILTELLKIDPAIRYSCCEGFCGTCETKVLEGLVDHRDTLLTEEDRQRKKTMMICASRALTDVLVLDI
ncbi:PDR/VanB family oxidoreductase [Hyphomicrobium sp.]|uniref:PDR/VanB family oxidoreductase n=1 Tax=Hyphomicrobium sp. TaxID=82 RepID=UPI002E381399|nr:PDR/VanB family oxidoreductase [Hyphomicrobium sp.]HEX2843136.1 PDR/VanB family oxidoreductase [Hyphomicrobium sp.]